MQIKTASNEKVEEALDNMVGEAADLCGENFQELQRFKVFQLILDMVCNSGLDAIVIIDSMLPLLYPFEHKLYLT